MLALTEAGATGGMTIAGILVYVVVIAGLFYFMLYRPQKKQQQKAKAMLDTLEVGDSVLTSSGFYGVVIDTAYFFFQTNFKFKILPFLTVQ